MSAYIKEIFQLNELSNSFEMLAENSSDKYEKKADIGLTLASYLLCLNSVCLHVHMSRENAYKLMFTILRAPSNA